MPTPTFADFQASIAMRQPVRLDILLTRTSIGLGGNRVVARRPDGTTIGGSSRLALANHPRRNLLRPLTNHPGWFHGA